MAVFITAEGQCRSSGRQDRQPYEGLLGFDTIWGCRFLHTHNSVTVKIEATHVFKIMSAYSPLSKYRGADRSLARPNHFSSNAEVIAAAETWLDGQPSELFLSGLQKLEFGRCSLFPSWSG